MFPCERLLGLDVPTQDYQCCDWCGEPSDTSVCPACQYQMACDEAETE